MRKIFILITGLLCCVAAMAQQEAFTLEGCRQKARQNYPLINRYGLLEQTREYTLANAGKGYLPQFSFSAKATYQTDITKVPIAGAPKMHKDQYQGMVEMNQVIWDGGVIRSQKQLTHANTEVERRQLNVDMYALEERVNNLYFGILLFDAQLQQMALLLDDLQRNHSTVCSLVDNGMANEADTDAVSVEILKAEQTRTGILSMRRAYMEMLAIMTGEPINEQTSFTKPVVDADIASTNVSRPELQLFRAQYDLFEAQKKQLTAATMPRLSFFAQGGYGRPGLNMLDSDFAFFGIGGFRLTWNISSLYTKKNEQRKLETNQQQVWAQQETFLYNTDLELTRESNEIRKMREVLKYDDRIVTLRRNVRQAAEAKMANGTLTYVELMREVDAENRARLDKIAHDIELLLAVYTYKHTKGNE